MTNTTFQTPTTPSSYFPETPPRKPRNNFIVIVVSIISVLLIGGVSLATKTWDPVWSPFRLSPERVMANTIERLKNVQTFHTDIKVNIKNQKQDSLSFTILADNDRRDADKVKSAAAFEVAVSQQKMSISLSGENIAVGRESYIKLNNIPLFFSAMLGQVQNQWISYPSGDTEETKVNQEAILQLQGLFKNKELYVVEKEFPDAKIGNVKTYHYLISLNKPGFKNILSEFFKVASESNYQSVPFGKVDFNEISSSLVDEFFDKVGEIKVEVWIGKKDDYLYRIKTEKTIDLKKITNVSSDEIVIDADIGFSKFNQDVKIEAPKDFKKFEEIFQQK